VVAKFIVLEVEMALIKKLFDWFLFGLFIVGAVLLVLSGLGFWGYGFSLSAMPLLELLSTIIFLSTGWALCMTSKYLYWRSRSIKLQKELQVIKQKS
jgi:hypothetical protein